MRSHRIIIFTIVLGSILLPLFSASSQSQSGTLVGTVSDPTGAVIQRARVTVRNQATGQERSSVTDDSGKFRLEGLTPGEYIITIEREGFRTTQQSVTISGGAPAGLEIRLEIAETRAEVAVGAKGALTPNSDPNYRAVRDAAVDQTYEINDVTLKRDAAVFKLISGRITFFKPVLDKVAMAVFVGEGEITLTPYLEIERNYIKALTGKESVTESFDRLVVTFTDQTLSEIRKSAKETAADAQAAALMKGFRERMRRNTERPRSLVEALFSGEDIENLDATLLAYLLNPKRGPMFNAWIHGRKHNDLRFYLRPYGAMPGLSPEEVALINFDPAGKEEGIWYLSHTEDELKTGKASSGEDKRLIDAEHYRIETVITGEKLTSTCELTFTSLLDGERVLTFGLLPTLRVTKVTMDNAEIGFIQEKKDDDSSFHAILPSPLVNGKQYKLTIEYQGTKVLDDAGGGNFAVSARTSWYPSVNSFYDKATFDLTFKIPNKFVLVGVGKLIKEGKEGDFAVSQWVSELPLAVAGFNYGRFKKKEVSDPQAKYQIEGYATSQLPDYMRAAEGIGGMSPSRLTDTAIVDAQNSIRIFNHWFGESPYGRIAITQQPQMSFGQSWPTLVYLPIIAFFDSTQRWQMFGIQNRLTSFIQEVTPHEVAHQWWGHIVGWSSYHDQWISEGFADFSAGLYLQYTQGGKLDRYLKFWDMQRQAILEKNAFGLRHNDAGPVWMGLRLNTARTPGAYSRVAYNKGSYVLHMLRWMMFDAQTGDKQFIEMMRDFVKSHSHQNASTESFKFFVEKHMKSGMDLDGNRRMDWFFNQWVYGTEIPQYKLEYSLTEDGGTTLSGTLTQSGVSPGFKMLVPIYLDFDGKIMRLGEIGITGNMTTQPFQVKLPRKPKRVMINYHHDVLATESASVAK
ncbi:MAG: carboxypeptidase regulatory-like domain-containing protein [Blastocatellales bacterium]